MEHPFGNRVLQAINIYWQEYYHSPSIRELTELSGLHSTNTVSYHIRRLVKSGDLMDFPFGQSRALVPVWVHEAIKQAVLRAAREK